MVQLAVKDTNMEDDFSVKDSFERIGFESHVGLRNFSFDGMNVAEGFRFLSQKSSNEHRNTKTSLSRLSLNRASSPQPL